MRRGSRSGAGSLSIEMEAQHVVSQAGLQLTERIRRCPRPGSHRLVWPWQPTLILTVTIPCAFNSDLRGDHCPAVDSALGESWDVTFTLTLPLIGKLDRNISLPRTITLHLSILVSCALTSALEGDHETRVASALATSLEQSVTVAKAPSLLGPNSSVCQQHAPGVQKRCRLTRHRTW